MICVTAFVVDVRSGRVFDLPFQSVSDGPCPASYAPESTRLFEFRADSRLLVVRGSYEDEPGEVVDRQECSARFYLWTGREFRLLDEVPYR